jgi:hypothetical protein
MQAGLFRSDPGVKADPAAHAELLSALGRILLCGKIFSFSA